MAFGRAAPSPATGTEATRRLFLAGLGLVLAIAHVSLWVQVDGLIGPRGILPSGAFLGALEEALDRHHALPTVTGGGAEALLATVRRALAKVAVAPTLGWFLPAAWAPHLLAAAGLLASVGVATRRYAGPSLLVAWVTYLSLSLLGQDFLGFQWDLLLVEVTFAALLVAPWGRHARFAASTAGWWTLGWILFRLVFFGGLVKLLSGDPTWRDGSAMSFHFATQPLPNGLATYAHGLPAWVSVLATVGTFVVELVLVFGMFAGRRGRAVAFLAIVLLMALLASTGNYGFFQLLTVVLATSLLDDGHLAPLLRGWRPPALPPLPTAGSVAVHAVGGLLVATSVVTALPRYGDVALPEPLARVADAVGPFRTVNHYGLFAVMTTERPIPLLEARWGDGPWTEITWRWQSSDPARPPAQVAPHMPRLDWQLWFAGLSGTCDAEPWTRDLMRRVLEGSPDVDDLVGDLRLRTGRPPDAVRMTLWRYDLAKGGASPPWTRTEVGPFCPELTRADAGIGP